MAHPLDGADLRFLRADRHLSEADQLIAEFSRACAPYVVTRRDPDTDAISITIETTPPLPVFLPLVVSDAIHNMRAALDYIVYELARHDSGTVQEDTQFPIENFKVGSNGGGFEAKVKRRLRGLTQAHVGAIERLQPYNGVEWTRTLRDISNPDKHRTLIALTDKFGYFSLSERRGLYEFCATPGVQLLGEGVSDLQWQVDAHDAIAIEGSNADQPALMRTLRNLQLEVCQTIEAFKPDF
jgi:hypothetical protein